MATPDAPEGQEEERVQKYREKLATIAAGGQARQYGLVVRGQALTADKIDALDSTEIKKMYARYEARLGGGDDEDVGVCCTPALCEGMPANIPPKEADQEQAVSVDKRPEHNCEGAPPARPCRRNIRGC